MVNLRKQPGLQVYFYSVQLYFFSSNCFLTSINTRATHGEHCVFVISYRNFSLLNVMHNHNLKNNVYVGIKYNV
jgi:hypothetical protein